MLNFGITLAMRIHTQQGDYTKINLALAKQWIVNALTLVFGIMVVTMLMMFIRYGTPLSSAQKSAISIKLMEGVNSLDLEDQENAERLRCERRQHHNAQMADAQI